MKKTLLLFGLMALSFSIIACTKQAAVVTPPTTGTPAPIATPAGVTIALDTFSIGCAAAIADVSAPVAAWLEQCPTLTSTIIAALKSSNAAGKAAAISAGVLAFVNSAPTTGIPPNDVIIVRSIVGAVNQFLALYQAQVVTASVTYTIHPGMAFADPKPKWAPNSGDKIVLEKMKERVAQMKAALKARKKAKK